MINFSSNNYAAAHQQAKASALKKIDAQLASQAETTQDPAVKALIEERRANLNEMMGEQNPGEQGVIVPSSPQEQQLLASREAALKQVDAQLAQLIETTTDPNQKAQLLQRRAELQSMMVIYGDQSVLQKQPQSDSPERLLLESKKTAFQKTDTQLAQLIETTTDPNQKSQLLKRRAELQEMIAGLNQQVIP